MWPFKSDGRKHGPEVERLPSVLSTFKTIVSGGVCFLSMAADGGPYDSDTGEAIRNGIHHSVKKVS